MNKGYGLTREDTPARVFSWFPWGGNPAMMSLVSALSTPGRRVHVPPALLLPSATAVQVLLVFGSLSTNLPGSSVPQGSDDHTWIIQHDTPV